MSPEVTMKPYVIGLDLGGTNSVFGIVDSRGDIKATTAIKTQGYESVDDYVNASVEALQIIIDQVGGIEKIKAMGIGAPNGNFYKGTIEFAPNLSWGHDGVVPLADMFSEKLGIPVLGVTAVGKDMARDARYFGLATRVCAENGASFVKTYYVDEGFEKVVAQCPVPIVIAGGKKLPEDKALELAYKAIQAGAAGVDMGRNVFQSAKPLAMMKAIAGVVHQGLTPQDAFQLYNDEK